METKFKNDLLSRLNDYLTKNRSSLSVEEVKELEKLALELKKTESSENEKKEPSKDAISNIIKEFAKFFLKHEIYNFFKELLD